MKKTVIATSIVVILGAGYTLASWYTGNIIENNIDAKIAQITNQIDQYKGLPDVNIQYSDYHKGIFSTSFNLTVNTVNLENHQNTLFNDKVTIYHGPFPWSEIKSGDFSPKMGAFIYQTSKESNESLWLAAGNKPFMTINSSIDYSENIKLTANNEPINYTNEELGTNLQATKNSLFLSIDNQLNNLVIQGQIDQLTLKNQMDYLEINHLVLTGNVVKYADLGYQAKTEVSIENGLIGRVNSNNENLNNNDSIKVNQLAININAARQNKRLTGDISSSVNNLFLGQQDLGKGEILANYTLPLNYDLSAETNDDKALRNWYVKLDKLLWHNQQGNLSASFTLNVADNDNMPWDQLDEDNLILAQAKVNLPLKPLTYLAAQISNPQKSMPDDNDIQSVTKSVVMLFGLFLNNSPIIDFNYDPNDEIEDGVSVDLYYSKEENQARLKGKSITTGQFWQALTRNKLPKFN
ncbi:DUF945 family protein [Orbus wheelerorum]|uniref:DUF945 family protein n=1 Tax=Orbus wheelerorum TaxID=3074111 RepID=UPI00370D7BBB